MENENMENGKTWNFIFYHFIGQLSQEIQLHKHAQMQRNASSILQKQSKDASKFNAEGTYSKIKPHQSHFVATQFSIHKYAPSLFIMGGRLSRVKSEIVFQKLEYNSVYSFYITNCPIVCVVGWNYILFSAGK